MKITFLGTGSAIPLPRHQRKFDPSSPLHDCPQCKSGDPRDRRWPSALLIDDHILIDAPPMILELLDSVGSKPGDLSVLFLTHRHRDAAGGLLTLPRGIHQVLPQIPGVSHHRGHAFEALKVPHDPQTWGYLIDNQLAYFSDYSDIRPALLALGRASIAVLDGSGWDTAFPTHQPMAQVVPQLERLANLKQVYFTHIGHTKIPHVTLERQLRELGDARFALAYHGLTTGISNS